MQIHLGQMFPGYHYPIEQPGGKEFADWTQPSVSPQTPNPTPYHRAKAPKSKRVRTIFTPEQLKRLEQEFSNQMYLVGNDRSYLASSLNLTEAQVKVWFQNRRIKHRKMNPGPPIRVVDEDDGYQTNQNQNQNQNLTQNHRDPDGGTISVAMDSTPWR